ncbi:MAG: zinc metallopeptidase [bacterium]|nr:zinc metallopeptidase [bacterium]
MFLFDEGFFLFVVPAMVFAMYAQAKVNGAYARASRLAPRSRLTGSQLARRVLDETGLPEVKVQRTDRHLGDHYDPARRVVRLSPAVHDQPSLAALGIAAHEVGHALQHHAGYAPLAVRNSFVPVARLGTGAAWPLFIIGLVVGAEPGIFLMNLAILFFGGAVLFHLITLPVEYNASSRAMAFLQTGGYLRPEEVGPTRQVLDAAALTYLAAAAAAIGNLARMLLLRQRRR